MKKKIVREARMGLPEDLGVATHRVEKTAYLEPEVAVAAEARRRGLGLSFSSYLNRLVRADLKTCKNPSKKEKTS